MAVTFTPAAVRDASWQRERAAAPGRGDFVLAVTSCVVALAIVLA